MDKLSIMEELKKYAECGYGVHYHNDRLGGPLTRCVNSDCDPDCDPEHMGPNNLMLFEAHHVERLLNNVVRMIVKDPGLLYRNEMNPSVGKLIYDEGFDAGYAAGYEDGVDDGVED